MEREHMQQWYGVSKDVYLIAAMALELDFAPDAEVPEDPDQNQLAYSRWLLDRTELDRQIKANPVGVR
jgi:hypothetical protein